MLAVEELQLLIQTGKEVRAFASFQEFERAAELAVALSKQSGGWRRALLAEGAGALKRSEGAPRGRRREPAPLCVPVTRRSGTGIVPTSG